MRAVVVRRRGRRVRSELRVPDVGARRSPRHAALRAVIGECAPRARTATEDGVEARSRGRAVVGGSGRVAGKGPRVARIVFRLLVAVGWRCKNPGGRNTAPPATPGSANMNTFPLRWLVAMWALCLVGCHPMAPGSLEGDEDATGADGGDGDATVAKTPTDGVADSTSDPRVPVDAFDAVMSDVVLDIAAPSEVGLDTAAPPEVGSACECAGRECGNNSCGASCGSCAPGTRCTPVGRCECAPVCDGRVCGDDRCGGSCGVCPVGYACADGRCVCLPQCAGRVCGPDQCGASCGSCASGYVCNSSGRCDCVPNCAGRECGSDSCGGSCGTCRYGGCSAGRCVCTRNCTGRTCGPDGCGGSCGACATGRACLSNGTCEVRCGNPGEACCTTGGPGCPSLVCNFGVAVCARSSSGTTCVACGHRGQLCCQDCNGNPLTAGCELGTQCVAGACIPR